MTDEDADRTTKGKIEMLASKRETGEERETEREREREREEATPRVRATRGLHRLLVNMYLSQQERPHNLGEFRSRCSFVYLHKPRQILPHMGGEER